ncbi:DUF4097 family beta strand repeat-containing protein [Nocardioides sp. BP30]|uniref:DUF4097 family beta strand repeat-containing protein n=1 Tax=Nocardioides sp. BP30 TaxID=3036374 RepID=UPI0024690F3B|nr:DUF4097 family beta strand repeat-containing protein [Nocardioides sp. BP30]WGL52309.1 DUF4097 family beta strand repeat-containing protein [Nocardioides sp. BP30]
MTTYDYETHGPVELSVELAKGRLTIDTTESNHAHIEISGRDADRVRVQQRGDRLDIADPNARRPFSFSHLDITVVVPAASGLALRTGTAEVEVTGTVGAAVVHTGTGPVRLDHVAGSAAVQSGSGAVTIASVDGDLRAKSGSGDITVGTAQDAVVVSTGSGDVAVRTANGPITVKTGNGDLRVAEAHGDVSLTTGSGSLEVGNAHRGRVVGKAASGHIRVGIPAGTPVWTDITTLTGHIRSGLRPVGQPLEGQGHVELRARTVSGDVTLVEV